MSEHNKVHITSYRQHAIVLLVLLFLTIVTVLAAEIKFTPAVSISVALGIASVKAFIVATYFMHLKYEKLIFRLMAGTAFALLAIVLIITFLDYGLR